MSCRNLCGRPPKAAGSQAHARELSGRLSLASARITSPLFVSVIRPTGCVYYHCIMTVQQVGARAGGASGIVSGAPGHYPTITTGHVMRFRHGREVAEARGISPRPRLPSAPLPRGPALFNHRAVERSARKIRLCLMRHTKDSRKGVKPRVSRRLLFSGGCTFPSRPFPLSSRPSRVICSGFIPPN